MKLIRFGRDFKPDEKVILRDYLAIERTRLANERTLLSYIRSSLYLLKRQKYHCFLFLQDAIQKN